MLILAEIFAVTTLATIVFFLISYQVGKWIIGPVEDRKDFMFTILLGVILTMFIIAVIASIGWFISYLITHNSSL